MPNIDFLPIVMNRRNQSVFIPPDVENGKAVHLIGGGKSGFQVSERNIIGFADDGMPMIQRGKCIGIFSGELDQPLSRDDMHDFILSQFEITVNGTAPAAG